MICFRQQSPLRRGAQHSTHAIYALLYMNCTYSWWCCPLLQRCVLLYTEKNTEHSIQIDTCGLSAITPSNGSLVYMRSHVANHFYGIYFCISPAHFTTLRYTLYDCVTLAHTLHTHARHYNVHTYMRNIILKTNGSVH